MKIYKVLGLLVMSAVFLAAASYLLLHAGGWAAGYALDRGVFGGACGKHRSDDDGKLCLYHHIGFGVREDTEFSGSQVA